MSSRSLLNLLLLAGLGALIALTVYEPGIEKPTPTRLTTLYANNITGLTLKHPDQIDIMLRREAGEWWMTQPYQTPATPFLDQNLAELLSAAASAHYPLADLDAKLVGLSPAVAILELGQVTLRFGDIEPVHGNRYVQAGDQVYLIPDHLTTFTSAEAIELLSPALLPKDSHITGINLPPLPAPDPGGDPRTVTGNNNPGPTKTPARTLSRVEGHWTLREQADPTGQAIPGTPSEAVSEPAAEPISALSGDDLSHWLDEWRYAQAIDITPLSQDKLATKAPGMNRIGLHLQDREPIHFLIIATTPDLVLARPDTGLSYRFSPEQAHRLLYPPGTDNNGYKAMGH
jgi:hypothetical protein